MPVRLFISISFSSIQNAAFILYNDNNRQQTITNTVIKLPYNEARIF